MWQCPPADPNPNPNPDQAKNGGTVRAEGKEYEVQDSDVLLFLFN